MANFPKPKVVEAEPPKPRPKKTTGNLEKEPRTKTGGVGEVVKKPLQFKVEKSIFEDFSKRAHEDFGHQKGAKLELFLAMWELYKNKS